MLWFWLTQMLTRVLEQFLIASIVLTLWERGATRTDKASLAVTQAQSEA